MQSLKRLGRRLRIGLDAVDLADDVAGPQTGLLCGTTGLHRQHAERQRMDAVRIRAEAWRMRTAIGVRRWDGNGLRLAVELEPVGNVRDGPADGRVREQDRVRVEHRRERRHAPTRSRPSSSSGAPCTAARACFTRFDAVSFGLGVL